MAMPPAVQSVYGRFWALAQDFAAARDETGAYAVQSPDFISAAAQLAREAGQALSFAETSGLPGLFSAARQIASATTSLNAAEPGTSIDSSMIAPWPTAASLATQAAQPQYMIKAEISYTDELGIDQQRWITLSGLTQLPTTTSHLALRVQGAAISALTTPPSEGGKYPLPGEMMSDFGEVLQMQIFTV